MASRNDDKNNEDGVGLLKKKTSNSLCESKNVNVEEGGEAARKERKEAKASVKGARLKQASFAELARKCETAMGAAKKTASMLRLKLKQMPNRQYHFALENKQVWDLSTLDEQDYDVLVMWIGHFAIAYAMKRNSAGSGKLEISMDSSKLVVISETT
jgi:hypothetical protein